MDAVRPAASRIYEFDVPTGTAGTYWYHPHAHQTTAEQVARGLGAPLIVRADDDPLAHLPDVTMFVSGLRLDRDAQISADNPMDWTLGRQGEALLVNGGRLPVHTVRPGATQRWRILNATSARYLRIALDGHTLTLVGTDGGLLAAPIAGLSEILIAPAQRIEVLVTVNATPNARYRLRSRRPYYGAGSGRVLGHRQQYVDGPPYPHSRDAIPACESGGCGGCDARAPLGLARHGQRALAAVRNDHGTSDDARQTDVPLPHSRA